MDSFDVSAGWVILSPSSVTDAAKDLAGRIAALRRRDGAGDHAPAILDAAGPAPEDSVPVILLNLEDGDNGRGGHSWRVGRDRVEIYGDSRRGLCNGIYSFLGGLGFRWPGPGQELLPPAPGGGPGNGAPAEAPASPYPLETGGAHAPSDPAPEQRRRLVISPRTPGREIPALCRWAARNRVDALVFSLRERKLAAAAAEAARWGLIIERGGWDLSFLVPRRHFLLKRDLFRMEEGRRRGDHHFCPTNPETIRLLRRRLGKLIGFRKPPEAAGRKTTGREAAGPQDPAPPGARRVYHLWPDRGAEHTWCACPACRAFSPREQIRLALNAAAAVLAEQDPWALISCRGEEESPGDRLPGGSDITLRPNVFALASGPLPEDRPPESPASGKPAALYLYEGGRISAW